MNLLDLLYLQRLENAQPLTDPSVDKAFAKIFQTFSKEQKLLWEEYDCLHNQHQQQETQRFYKQGVKDGIDLMSNVFKPSM